MPPSHDGLDLTRIWRRIETHINKLMVSFEMNHQHCALTQSFSNSLLDYWMDIRKPIYI
jgi:hypothetical protein